MKQISMKKTSLKVGFDLDGVLLYNPARIFRPITIVAKTILRHKSPTKTEFYYPKSTIEKILWNIVHWSSLFIAPGFEDIKELAKEGKINAYIVTSRYDCLKGDFARWLNKMNAEVVFIDTFHNKNNLQPHIFKEKKINELGLDLFVEDNWDIVRHISTHTKTKGLWITNAIDKSISYELKFLSLKSAMNYIRLILSDQIHP
ncbi:hypothetical protein COY16_01235 [Candidatus Roizmanbacteria bacterium CG_4_10_14_0_2_um_filter_39_13]|uniref:FCP1 homology domain-containing protein n=1 Tax=Candidatus Roizmanbacteria bacterium CG_4_10_14_0_2_um_filter_39_13 TaxID=1974825 RepID=A0A2M7U0T0_9BACT|nr:MAG: hypothetical protein COY16_01235 [Candidatus Roizmanbacteria bacterium CG_4_10_14_0_2_um_filter_39_13]